jgi:NADH-quinone oxidoreductase subunit L
VLIEYPWLIPLAPLVAFGINGLLGPRYLKKATGVIGSTGILVAFLLTVAMWRQGEYGQATLFQWVASGSLTVDVGFLVDELTIVMLLVVTGVSFLVHVYSIGYMAHDRSFARFFAWLPLFVFSMVMLVMANNFLTLFVFWELVGVCSYLLIGFWHDRESANNAAMKAFLVNRVGDFGFAIAVFMIFWNFRTLEYGEVFANLDSVESSTLLIIALLLFVGAMGKSAQFPLHIWLPDAMEGPTPVSALIHAATMVTAGVYMVARTIPIFEVHSAALIVVGGIGAFTALFAATIALAQTDIKRVLAYSTISQLGLMFLGLASGAYVAAIFHLATHAFFKALLFLGSGSVIHAMQDEQEMTKYGALRRKLKWTYGTFLVGGLALSAIFPLAGFWSKDEILAGAFIRGISGDGNPIFAFYWVVGLTVSLLTAFYTFRMVIMTFHGDARDKELHESAHESPAVMIVPLVVLALLAAGAGAVLGFPPEEGMVHDFLHNVPGTAHFELSGVQTIAIALAVISTAVALLGALSAYMIYSRRRPRAESIGRLVPGMHTLLYRKYYVDEIVDYGIVAVTKVIGFILWAIDAKIVDGLVNLLGWIVRSLSAVTRRVQTGQVQNYVFIMALGAVVSVGALAVFR